MAAPAHFTSTYFHENINPKDYRVDQKFRLHKYQTVAIIRERAKVDESLALRLRIGPAGHAQWCREVRLYSRPNFEHRNILALIGYNKRAIQENRDSTFKSETILRDFPEESSQGSLPSNYGPETEQTWAARELLTEEQQRREEFLARVRARRLPIEYWLANDFSGCVTLRHYLMQNTLTWSQMLRIAKGIMMGLHFLHEQAEYYRRRYKRKEVKKFIRSTEGRLKEISFDKQGTRIHMKPYFSITVLHRNLSSLSVVLHKDLRPCLWDFGASKTIPEFTHVGSALNVTKPVRNMLKSSRYSSPEVLSGQAHLTLATLKSIDMYACGFIFWELISRTVLPKLQGSGPCWIETKNKFEKTSLLKRRDEPYAYMPPFEVEFGKPVPKGMLYHAVCRMRARPQALDAWMIGRKTNRFVETYRDMWDHDADARIGPMVVFNRLTMLGDSNVDKVYRYNYRKDVLFVKKRMWPSNPEVFMAPVFPCSCKSNIVCHEPSSSGPPLSSSEHSSLSSSSSSSSHPSTHHNPPSTSSQQWPESPSERPPGTGWQDDSSVELPDSPQAPSQQSSTGQFKPPSRLSELQDVGDAGGGGNSSSS